MPPCDKHSDAISKVDVSRDRTSEAEANVERERCANVEQIGKTFRELRRQTEHIHAQSIALDEGIVALHSGDRTNKALARAVILQHDASNLALFPKRNSSFREFSKQRSSVIRLAGKSELPSVPILRLVVSITGGERPPKVI